MKVELVDSTTDAAWVISHAARTCYNSKDKDDIWFVLRVWGIIGFGASVLLTLEKCREYVRTKSSGTESGARSVLNPSVLLMCPKTKSYYPIIYKQ